MARIEQAAGEAPCEIKDLPATAPLRRVVEFDRVTKTFHPGTRKEFTAIREVTFQVEDRPDIGEFIGILGPSGCGKSTVLRLIAGLAPQFPATSGSVLVDGQPVSAPGPDRGFVFQDYANFPHRTVLENVAFGLECQHVPEKERLERARGWIAKVGLDPVKDAGKYPHQLSGGMNQRVAIARTLILHPRIILMDEPFGALDPSTRQNMQDLLVALWRELEATVFFITHDVAEAVFLADRVYIFSASPGTIAHQVAVAPPDRPSAEMQALPSFQESVREIRRLLDRAGSTTPK
ncbi:MAG: ABC transporter ATP-binding protein [Akkermansiaceae bacterium]|jgi:NitT/TauT family transport system ATP-binding protein|nr:ABC transporter ATP-binding protein [Akkermansiaceae bacterium]